MVDKDKKEVKYNEKREDEIDEEENTPNDEDNFGLNPPSMFFIAVLTCSKRSSQVIILI